MKIFLIDDNRDNIQSKHEYLSHEKYKNILTVINHISKGGVKDALTGATGVMIHDSFVFSDENGYFDENSTDEFWKEFNAVFPSVPLVSFSGGFSISNYEAENNYAELKKDQFYDKFQGFLDKCLAEGVLDLKGLAEGTITSACVSESVNAADLVSVSPSEMPADLNDNKALVDFVNGHKDAKGFRFDVDTLTPESIRFLAIFIRLSLFEIGSTALVPFVFSTLLTKGDLVDKFVRVGAADILICGGSYVEAAGSPLPTLRPLDAATYKRDFFDRVKVNPLATSGRHTIANDWGAYVVGRMLGINASSLTAETKDPLYLRYLRVSQLDVPGIEEVLSGKSASKTGEKIALPQKVGCKKILFIDDQDDVWEDVIRHLFPRPHYSGASGFDLTVIGRKNGGITDNPNDRNTCWLTSDRYDKVLARCADYDLIILDLRLGGSMEENISNSDDLSGIKLLREITSRNKGVQVIIFTSSNKSWNMKKALLDYNAAGYYIKESPDQPVSSAESAENFRQFIALVDSCLNKHYLKDLVADWQELKPRLADPRISPFAETQLGEIFEEDFEDIASQIALALNMHLAASRTNSNDGYAYSFIALEQVFEITRKWHPDYLTDSPLSTPANSVPCIVFDGERDIQNHIKLLIRSRNHFIHHNDEEEPPIKIYDPQTFCMLWDYIKQFLLRVTED